LDWLAPFEVFLDENDWLQQWGNNGIQTFVELDKKADVAAINKKLDRYIKSKDTSAVAQPFLLSMNDWRLRSNFEEGKHTVAVFSMFACSALLHGSYFSLVVSIS
jgi:hypothetical protein